VSGIQENLQFTNTNEWDHSDYEGYARNHLCDDQKKCMDVYVYVFSLFWWKQYTSADKATLECLYNALVFWICLCNAEVLELFDLSVNYMMRDMRRRMSEIMLFLHEAQSNSQQLQNMDPVSLHPHGHVAPFIPCVLQALLSSRYIVQYFEIYKRMADTVALTSHSHAVNPQTVISLALANFVASYQSIACSQKQGRAQTLHLPTQFENGLRTVQIEGVEHISDFLNIIMGATTISTDAAPDDSVDLCKPDELMWPFTCIVGGSTLQFECQQDGCTHHGDLEVVWPFIVLDAGGENTRIFDLDALVCPVHNTETAVAEYENTLYPHTIIMTVDHNPPEGEALAGVAVHPRLFVDPDDHSLTHTSSENLLEPDVFPELWELVSLVQLADDGYRAYVLRQGVWWMCKGTECSRVAMGWTPSADGELDPSCHMLVYSKVIYHEIHSGTASPEPADNGGGSDAASHEGGHSASGDKAVTPCTDDM